MKNYHVLVRKFLTVATLQHFILANDRQFHSSMGDLSQEKTELSGTRSTELKYDMVWRTKPKRHRHITTYSVRTVALWRQFLQTEKLLHRSYIYQSFILNCYIMEPTDCNSINFPCASVTWLTLSKRNLSPWRKKSSGVSQSTIIQIL